VDRPRHPRAGSGSPLGSARARSRTLGSRGIAAAARRARRTGVLRLRRRLRPPRSLRPTRAGWIFFALTLGVGLAALNTGNNLLYLVLSFMLSFLVLSGVLSESALRGVRVQRRVAREVFAGQPAPVALEIANEQRRVPSFALVVEDLEAARGGRGLGAPVGRVFALRVPPGGTETRTYPLVAPCRGELVLGGFRVSTRFPFGLFSKSMRLDWPQHLLVYPGLEPGVSRPPAGSRRREGEARSAMRREGTEVTGLREYVPGDPHRRVHWRASLRRGELLVRETESPRDARVLVRLATRTAPGPEFEAAVRRAASQVVAGLESGLQVGLRTDATALPAGHGPRQRAALLAFLARVEATPEAAEVAA